MSINLEYFRVFYHVATQRNISKAAQLMFLSQPTISNQLHALEKQIGYSLFYRLPRGVELTPEGMFLFNEIAPAIENLLVAEKRAEELRHGSEGTIHISYNSNTTEQLFSPFLKKFKEEHPNITILTCQMSRWSLRKALHSGVIDLAVACRPDSPTPLYDADFPPPENMGTLPGEVAQYLLYTFEDKIIAGREFAFLGGKVRHAEELGMYPVLLHTKQELKAKPEYVTKFYLNLFRQSPEVQQKNIAVTDIDSMLNMIRGNFGLGILPAFLCERSIEEAPEDLVPIQIHEKMMTNQFVMHYSESHRPSLIALKLIEYLLNHPLFSPVRIGCSI